jgi:hypothetical protein
MRLQAYLTQALPPAATADNQFLRSLEGTIMEYHSFFKGLQWHPFYIVLLTNIDTVIGETVVTPSSIVYLLV